MFQSLTLFSPDKPGGSHSFHSDSSDLEFDFSDSERTEAFSEIRDVQCDSPCYSGEDVSDGELSNAESSDSFEGQHVSIKLVHQNVGSSLYSKRTVQKPNNYYLL